MKADTNNHINGGKQQINSVISITT